MCVCLLRRENNYKLIMGKQYCSIVVNRFPARRYLYHKEKTASLGDLSITREQTQASSVPGRLKELARE